MKVIETRYKGYRFRSRLEARWAVFFDVLGVPYDYEPEGFDLEGVGWYLPDFWLPSLECWVEVKPTIPQEIEQWKAFQLADTSAKPVALTIGTPGVIEPSLRNGQWVTSYQIDVFVGYHPPDQFAVCRDAFWPWSSDTGVPPLHEFVSTKFPPDQVPTWDGTRSTLERLVSLDRLYFQDTYQKEHPHWQYGIVHRNGSWDYSDRLTIAFLNVPFKRSHQRLSAAYDIARSSRFEHGDHGR